MSGRSKDPVYTEWPSSNYSLSYPALNADSMLVPPYVKVETYQNGVLKQTSETTTSQECIAISNEFNEVRLAYKGQNTEANI